MDVQLPRKSQSGFSLIEVLIASIVMTVGVFGLLAVFPQSLQSTRDTGRMSVLNHLAVQRLENLRSLDLANGDLAVGTHPGQDVDSKGARYYSVSGMDEEYSLRWIVQDGPTDQSGTPEPEMRSVTVEATYLVRYAMDGTALKAPRSLEVRFQSYFTD